MAAQRHLAVFLATFSLTVIIDLTRCSRNRDGSGGWYYCSSDEFPRPHKSPLWTKPPRRKARTHSLIGKEIPRRRHGLSHIWFVFLWRAADKLESALKRLKQEPDVLILRMRKVLAMDATGLNALEDLYERLRRHHKHLILSGPSYPASIHDG